MSEFCVQLHVVRVRTTNNHSPRAAVASELYRGNDLP